MIDPFYLASVPEPRTVLGLRLKPFSLGHVILLNRIESAFVTGGVPDYNDLAASVFICALTFEDALASFDDPDRDRVMRLWHDRITGADRWSVRLGWRKPKLVDLADGCRLFSDYLTEHSKVPKYSFNAEDFREMECPQVQVVKMTLMRDLHIPEAELLNRSWGLCLWDYVTLKAMKGEVRLYKQEDMDDALAAAKRLHDRLNAKEGQCQS